MMANLSTSDDMREFFLRQGKAQQCAESGYQRGQCGANYTDNPLALVSSRMGTCGGVHPTTNGTPPDGVNPMVYQPSNFRPRPSLLPGVGLDQANAPTAHKAAMKALSPWQSTGFLPPNVFCGQQTDSLHSPIQQASDLDHAGSLSRHQACYIQPTRKVKNYCQNQGHFSPSELPDVRVDGFPHSSKYSNIDEGVLIYSSEVS